MHESSLRRLAVFVTLASVAACSGTVGLGENRSAVSSLDAGFADGSMSSGDNSDSGATILTDGGATSDARSPADGGGMKDASTACSCALPTEICVANRGIGGAQVVPDDAGSCPVGRHVEGLLCQSDWTYSCQARPLGCSATIDCTCAAFFCSDLGFGSACSVRQSTSSDLECQLLVP
jgi:hypothetical protein